MIVIRNRLENDAFKFDNLLSVVKDDFDLNLKAIYFVTGSGRYAQLYPV